MLDGYNYALPKVNANQLREEKSSEYQKALFSFLLSEGQEISRDVKRTEII